ncbi:PREDICTED: leucine-rich repeat-containing protein 48-like [Ceratosolen solmsi marchali]|uniref:Dynein axonemal assembly factor 1 homolog n=1 Tax=Ceratosolen solmsi marchali TaxID=326594 RepID=A0AAJ7E0R4_9HYME|nr:PREDICTED: leucine-rich repeat-containing protein 48-like [Ceratosolen solmsi marchali]
MLQSHESKKYTIITKDLILTLANEQQSRRRRRRTIDVLNKIEEIRLEYLNILQIDCLWPLTNLVKLKLNNNVIEKIENLENLKNLCELDLSFNRIKIIENLESLTNIHILTLYDNKIEVIEGIEHMQNLTIFSIGKNNIKDFDHILFLRYLKNLRSLQMEGNPCTQQNGYTSYLIGFIPQLIYFGYKMITKEERANANKIHQRAIESLMETETKKENELKTIKSAENKVVELSASYVEYLDDNCLFELMFKEDEDGTNFAKFNEEFISLFEQYKQNFSDICHQLYNIGITEENRRRSEVEALYSIMHDKLINAINKARQIMDSVQGKRVEISVRITQLLREAAIADADLDDDAIDEIDKVARQLSQEFHDYTNTIWAKLMYDETLIHDQIDEMSKIFEINISDMVTSFLECAQDYFSQLRSLETEYFETLLPLLSYFLSNIDEENKTSFIADLTEEKDTLSNRLTTSHFLHIQIIDDRQDTMLRRLKDWQSNFLKKLIENEITRHRNQILEITYFLDHHRQNTSVSMLIGQQLNIEENENENEYKVNSDIEAEN